MAAFMSFLQGVDAATAAEIIRLQMEDLDSQPSMAEETRDAHLASKFMKDYLFQSAQSVTDEQVARHFRDTSVPPTNDGLWIDRDGRWTGMDYLTELTTRHSSNPHETCQACAEEMPLTDIALAPCKHGYCRSCLGHLFEAAMSDEAMFPPRCCRTTIPLDDVRGFLTDQLVGDFFDKQEELSSTDRTYCHIPTCSAFIPSNAIDRNGDRGTCPQCARQTCTICKAAAHNGECPEDEGLRQLFAVANQQRWRRCFQCRAYVMRTFGCNHIVCRCGAEFCYQCGARWPAWGCQCAINQDVVARNTNQIQQNHPWLAPRRRVDNAYLLRLDALRRRCLQCGQEKRSYLCQCTVAQELTAEVRPQARPTINVWPRLPVDNTLRPLSCRACGSQSSQAIVPGADYRNEERQRVCDLCVRVRIRTLTECQQCRLRICAGCRRLRR